MSVSNIPATRMVTPRPNGATSSARASAQRSRAPLAAEYALIDGMPRTPPWLEITTIRPRPAARMDGSSSWVSRTAPNRFVRNSRSHASKGISSTHATAAIPALCTSASGAPTASSMTLAPAWIDAGSSRSSRTPIKRGSPTPARVAARRRSSPASGERMAATTRHPRSYRWVADARPSPRDAPVITTLRRSRTARPATSTVRRRRNDRTPRRLGTHPAVPVALEERAGMPLLLIEAVGVVDLGFWKRIGARDGCRELRRPDGGEARAVHEIRHVQDGEHHQERAEGRAVGEPTSLLDQPLGLRASGVVPMAEDACGDHHHRDERRLPDQRELEGRSGEHRAPRHHLRVDVQPGMDREDLEYRVEDEPRDEEQQPQGDEWAAPNE